MDSGWHKFSRFGENSVPTVPIPTSYFQPIVTGSQAKISKRRNFRSKISLTAAHHNKMVRMAV